MLQDIGVNIISDILFVLLALGTAWIYYYFSKRKKLLKFFGIERTRRIIIYQSKIDVLRGGSTGTDRIRRSFQGEAVSNEESKASLYFKSLFNNFLPSWGDKPGILDKLLIADVDVQILISPATPQQVDNSTSFIALGSFAYNAAAEYMDSRDDALIKFKNIPFPEQILDKDKNTSNLPSISSASVVEVTSPDLGGGTINPSGVTVLTPFGEYDAGHRIPPGSDQFLSSPEQKTVPGLLIQGKPPYTDPDLGYIERIYDAENQRYLFCVAGISEIGTAGAAYYLKSNWEKLEKEFKESKSFVELRRFEASDYKHSVRIIVETR